MTDFRKPARKYTDPDELYGAPPQDFAQGANDFRNPQLVDPTAIDELAKLGANMVPSPEDIHAKENPKTIAERLQAKRYDDRMAEIRANPAAAAGTLNGRFVPGYSGGTDGKGGTNWRSTLSADEAWIIQRESGFDPNAWNDTVVYDQGRRLGNAHGLGQIVSDVPRDQRSVDPNEQLAAFRAYVASRYGTAAEAVKFWQANGWY